MRARPARRANELCPSPQVVDRLLLSAYGDPGPPQKRSPLDQLILTVLSQNTSSANCRRAFANLKARWGSWEDVQQAPVSALEKAIRPAGLAAVRSRRIRQILAYVAAERGRPSLGFLRRLPDEKAMDYLLLLPGVGPKTAACVLLFSLGRPVFPVDTHIHRIALRLGWVAPGCAPEEAFGLLNPRISPRLRYRLHLNLIAHRRETCRPIQPRCPDCVLLTHCGWGRERLAGLAVDLAARRTENISGGRPASGEQAGIHPLSGGGKSRRP